MPTPKLITADMSPGLIFHALQDAAQIYQTLAQQSLEPSDFAHAKRYRAAAQAVHQLLAAHDDVTIQLHKARNELNEFVHRPRRRAGEAAKEESSAGEEGSYRCDICGSPCCSRIGDAPGQERTVLRCLQEAWLLGCNRIAAVWRAWLWRSVDQQHVPADADRERRAG